jgi:DNA-binding NarL/FixJ family response regulator
MISPRTSVVVLTMEDDPAFIREALSAGVSGISHDRVVVSED